MVFVQQLEDSLVKIEAKKKLYLDEKKALLKEIAKAEERIRKMQAAGQKSQNTTHATSTSKNFLEVAKSAVQ